MAKGWDEWLPGPDIDNENLAKTEGQKRLVRSGRDFLSIARDVMLGEA